VNEPPVDRGSRGSRRSFGRAASSASSAFFDYVVLTLALTWPLARGIARDIPGDFGDPLFTMWVLSWDLTHLGHGWWSANIFYPHPLALAYSEHFLPQAVSIAPIYFLTHNPILCYNLLFLSTFVLSAFGMYLFARELTGMPEAALVAGFAYGFMPYRVSSLPHLQVLSSAGLPFALFGLRRYFSTRSSRVLAGAMAAWFLQNLSCGYYLFFLSPIVVLYALWELTTRRLWTNARVIGEVASASALTLAATAWFIRPYVELRRLVFKPRQLGEVLYYSADVYAYLTADPNLRVWGRIAQAWPHAEGLLFPGLTIVTLTAVALVVSLQRARHASQYRFTTEWTERATAFVGWTLAVLAGLLVFLLFGYEIRTPVLKITRFSRCAWIASAVGVGFLAASARARQISQSWIASPAGCFSLIAVFAVAMSFGPAVQAKGALVTRTSLYAAFYHYVPGFDGVRVPARFAMALSSALAVLCALGIAAIDPIRRRGVAFAASVCIAIEATATPIPLNQTSMGYKQQGLSPLPPHVEIGAVVPAVYKRVADLPSSATLVELPLGEPAFDIRYMFYSTEHWRPLVNGYSGGAPDDYELLGGLLQDVGTGRGQDGGGRLSISPSDPEQRAWQALASSGATHAIVHQGFYAGDRGPRISSWIRAHGGHEVAAFGDDHLFQLR